jgi:hypothetical protein
MHAVLALAVAAAAGLPGPWRTVETQSPLLSPRETRVVSWELPTRIQGVRVTLRARAAARVGLSAAVSCGTWTRTLRARVETEPVERMLRVPRAVGTDSRCDLLLALTNAGGNAVRLDLAASVR